MGWFNFLRRKKNISKKPDKVTAKCGHPVDPDGSQTWCDECYEKMDIVCAWCGEFIPVGGIVTNFIPAPEDKVHEKAVHFGEGVIGCGRNTCCSSGSDYVGRLKEDCTIAFFTDGDEKFLSL